MWVCTLTSQSLAGGKKLFLQNNIHTFMGKQLGAFLCEIKLFPSLTKAFSNLTKPRGTILNPEKPAARANP